MAAPIRDLTNQKFGRLLVKDKQVVRDRYKWKCLCDCGTTAFVEERNLIGGHTKSCGCLMREINRARSKTNGRHVEPEYIVWKNMNQKSPGTNRRIPYEVEPDWQKSYETFYDDVGPRPSPKHRLCRVVLELGFVRGNCVWRAPKSADRRESDS